MDADRIDTADFMSGEDAASVPDCDALWEQMEKNLHTKLQDLSEKTDAVSRCRGEISQQCGKFAEHPVGICRLVVPTGGGKTLSALRFAIEQCRRFHKKKIIYIAPFMSIIEQNADIIRSLCGDEAFLEYHSNAIGEIAGRENSEEYAEYELRAERFDSPVIATTQVQFLNTLFGGKATQIHRMHRFSQAVILIDEIQSLPLKCTYLFNLAINFLSRICGTVVVLCSATQPPLELLSKYPLLQDKDWDMTGGSPRSGAPKSSISREKIPTPTRRRPIFA